MPNYNSPSSAASFIIYFYLISFEYVIISELISSGGKGGGLGWGRKPKWYKIVDTNI